MTLLAIGAGASALALIAFSGTCWLASSCLGESVAGDITFWEILAVSFGGSAVLLLVRPMARRSRSPDTGSTPDAATSNQQTATEDFPSRWRQLYDQLSEDERKAFKAAMKRYCDR